MTPRPGGATIEGAEERDMRVKFTIPLLAAAIVAACISTAGADTVVPLASPPLVTAVGSVASNGTVFHTSHAVEVTRTAVGTYLVRFLPGYPTSVEFGLTSGGAPACSVVVTRFWRGQCVLGVVATDRFQVLTFDRFGFPQDAAFQFQAVGVPVRLP